MTKKGLFIVIEGPDGAGTTLHSRLLAERLADEGHEVVLTAEPTDGPIGVWIRKQLKEKIHPIPASSLQILFTADRAWHIEHVVLPALTAGKTVISDRYSPSTVTYGEALGLDREWLEKMNVSFSKPDIMIFALPDLSVCLERIGRRKKKEIYEVEPLQKKIHAAYRDYAKRHTDVIIIDTGREKKESAEDILKLVQKSL